MEIPDLNALVTGGAHRVGGAISRALAEAGANVFIHYGRSANAAELMATDLSTLGVRVAIGGADLSNPRTAGELLDTATEALGPISILVNSASGFPEDSLADITLDGLRSTMALTLESPIMLMQAMASRLDGAPGAIVNISDVRTQTPPLKHFSYTVAKGAIDTATRAAALALAPAVRVNAVALGVILSPLGEGADYVAELASRLPAKRAGGSETVTQAVLHFISNDFVTGEILRLDGGSHLV